jgi:D-sedoheptulose 7-phosphate isomerase
VLREIADEHSRVLAETLATQSEAFEQVAGMAESCLRAGGKILVFGNGGSAADAQHFAAELVGRFEHDRQGLPALALTVNTSTLTAVANDYGFDRIFARQVEALGQPGDLAIAISTSGESGNVLAAARAARDLGCKVVGMTGARGGTLVEYTDALIAVPSRTVARIQEMHEICLHALAAVLEKRMFSEAGE